MTNNRGIKFTSENILDHMAMVASLTEGRRPALT